MNTVSTDVIQAPQPQPQQINLAIQDLQNLLIILDLACQRGAFRATELSQIGGLFDRVNQFVQSTVPQQDPIPDAVPQPVPQMVPQQPMTASPVMPMTPPFSPKVGA